MLHLWDHVKCRKIPINIFQFHNIFPVMVRDGSRFVNISYFILWQVFIAYISVESGI